MTYGKLIIMSNKVLFLSFAAVTLLLTPSLARGQNAIIQHGSTTATSTGTNNLAVSGVNQYAEQNQFGYPTNSNQLAIQEGTSNAEATGYGNTSIGVVDQNIIQNQHHPYGNNDFIQQTAVQQGYSDQRAIGEHNINSGYLGQYSTQQQLSH